MAITRQRLVVTEEVLKELLEDYKKVASAAIGSDPFQQAIRSLRRLGKDNSDPTIVQLQEESRKLTEAREMVIHITGVLSVLSQKLSSGQRRSSSRQGSPEPVETPSSESSGFLSEDQRSQLTEIRQRLTEDDPSDNGDIEGNSTSSLSEGARKGLHSFALRLLTKAVVPESSLPTTMDEAIAVAWPEGVDDKKRTAIITTLDNALVTLEETEMEVMGGDLSRVSTKLANLHKALSGRDIRIFQLKAIVESWKASSAQVEE